MKRPSCPRSRSTRASARVTLCYEQLEVKNLLAGIPVISEFMASNNFSLNDGYGSSEDWIELSNRGDAPVNLTGYHLTDDPLNPTKWTFTQQTFLQPGDHLVVFASGRDEVDPAGNQHTNFKLSAGGEYVALGAPGGFVLSEFGSATSDYDPQLADVSYGTSGGSLVNSDSPSHYLVPSNGSLGTSWTSNGFNASAAGFTAGRASLGYETSLGSSTSYAGLFEEELPSGTTSVYLRTEFEVSDASAVSDLTLGLQYDDGFAVYLNGTFLFSRNSANGLAWNASASQSHNDVSAIQVTNFKLDGTSGSEGNFLNLLVDGTNTLAIHALNRPSSSDMLMIPTLSSNSIGGPVGYLTTPTPGSANSALVDLGPRIDDVTPSATSANPNQPFVVTAKVSDFGRAVDTSSVRLFSRHQYGNEFSYVMSDSGTAGDAVAGDGVYTATIPGGLLSAGEMLRWRVTAADVEGNVTRGPTFLDPLNSAEYFGTVVSDPSITTDLPVFQWFVEDPAAASTNNGTRGSLFYNGEFYDNIQFDNHGQSTRGPDFVKKSFDFDANSGEKFLISDGYRASDFNLLTNYADQTKIRHTLGYDAFGQADLPTHLAFSVLVYQNGDFYGLYDIVEEGDEEYLERNGLDPNGALYKVNNPLNDAYNQVEKKSREYEDHSDFQEVVNGRNLSGSAAITWDYDNLDIADVINYTATQNVIASADFGHKNMYWYHDIEGTGLWSVLPWDQDLSYGHKWTQNVSPPYFDNTLHQNQSLTTGWNNIFQRFYSNPTLREMYNRRLRTLSDQLYGAPGTSVSSSYLAQRIDQLDASIADEAIADSNEWGLQSNFAAAYPFNVDQAIDQVRNVWIQSQRNHIGNQGNVPSSQSTNPTITFDDNDYDASPASGLQSEEYIRLRNNNGTAIDISGWELTGGIRHTFKGGTVIPAGGSLYVVADVAAFQNRTTGPRAGQQLFIQGNYEGQLSSGGETVNLVSTSGATIDVLTTPAEGASDNQQFLRITEVNYNPNDPAGAAEFIELRNVSSGSNAKTLNLAGVSITEGPSIPFEFAAGTTLAAGERILVVKNLAAFQAAYPSVSGSLIAGEFMGGLSNGGETIRLDDAGGERIVEFTYNDADPWALAADGAGASLQLVDEVSTPTNLLNKYYSWRASNRLGGTPGEGPVASNPNIVISEVLAHTDDPQKDFIELHNPSGSAIDVSGWWLSDTDSQLQKYQIPTGAVIAAGGYVSFDETQFNPNPLLPGPNDFALSSAGDEVWLTNAIANVGTAVIDVLQFGATFNGESLGRMPADGGRLSPLAAPTPGEANRAARVGLVLITEVQYHPDDPTASDLQIASDLTTSDLEFVEIHNPTGADVSLVNWQLSGGVDYDFAAISLAAGSTALVLRFDPDLAENANKVTAFRNHYSIGASVALIGGYAGTLSNSFARVEIQQPDAPSPEDPTSIPRVTSDEVLYDDLAPWPDADGNGDSLQRVAGNASGNLVASWIAQAPTPGAVSLLATAPQVTAVVRDGGGELVRPDLMEAISFRFDTDVSVSAGALELTNETLGGQSVDISDAVFSYDPTLRQATWDFGDLSEPLPAAFYNATLVANQISGVGSDLSLAEDSTTSVYVALPGDANLDGKVDVLTDAATLVENLGTDSGAIWATADFTGDGDVDVIGSGSSPGDAVTLVNFLGASVQVPTASRSASRFFRVSALAAGQPKASAFSGSVDDRNERSELSPAGTSTLAVAAEMAGQSQADEWSVANIDKDDSSDSNARDAVFEGASVGDESSDAFASPLDGLV